MNKSLLLVAALALALPTVWTDSAQASVDRTPGAGEKKSSAKAPKQVQQYPDATRVEPKQSGNASLAKAMAKVYEQYESKQYAEALAGADAVLANPKAAPYDRATAAYMASFIAPELDGDNNANAIRYIERALQENGLSNNQHFQLMLQAAQLLTSDDKHAEALAYIDRFLTETRSQDVKALQVKGAILYQMERYPESADAIQKAMAADPANVSESMVRLLVADFQEMGKTAEAVAMLEKLLAAKPKDKPLLQSLIGVYQAAGEDAKAGQAFDRLRAAGLMTETKDYEFAYRLLANTEGREQDAVAIINEGLEKKILTPSYDVYLVLGNAFYNADQIDKTIDAWTKAAPMGKDGEMYLNVAKLQLGEEHNNEAKEAARQALAKGVKKPGEAWVVIGNAELVLGNKAAMIAAFREAAKHPETKKQAETMLRQAGAK